jgi:hypothetical protein
MTTQHDTDNGTPGITDAQAAALYAFVRKHLTPQLIEAAQNVHHLTYGLQMWMQTTNGDIVDMAALLSEIDSAHEGGKAEGGKRYEVRNTIHGIPYIWDNAIDGLANIKVASHDTIKLAIICEHLNAQEASKP